MAENKKPFILYADLIHTVEKLPISKAGELFKLILEYVNDKNPNTEDLLLQVAFEPIKQALKRDLKKYEEIRKMRAEYGKNGGLAKATKSYQKLPKAKQTVANLADNVNDNDTKEIYKEKFEVFRKAYPGKKYGLQSEWDNFIRKNTPETTDLLLPALIAETDDRVKKANEGSFVPEWKILQTWINKKCWEQEFEAGDIDRSQLPGYDPKIERAIDSYQNQGWKLLPEHNEYLKSLQPA